MSYYCPACAASSTVVSRRGGLRQRRCVGGCGLFSTVEVDGVEAHAQGRPLKTHKLRMVRTAHKLGHAPERIARAAGVAVEVVRWYTHPDNYKYGDRDS